MSRRSRVRFDVASVAGIVAGVGLVLVGQAVEGGSVRSLLQPTAALIVFGGTFGAVLLAYSRNDVLRAVRSMGTVFLWDGEPLSGTIDTVFAYAMRARKEGILSLDRDITKIGDPFLKKAIQLLVDATNPEVLRELLETESQGREDYDEVPARVFEAAGGYAPTIGILGAVIGLIQVMEHLSDPSKLGEGIAVAFVATVYGVGSANLFFLPAATKLKMKARHEARGRELIIEGVLAIQDGMNPRTIHEKLCGFACQTVPVPVPVPVAVAGKPEKKAGPSHVS
ncbi:MAG: flagellar motor protein [Vicinamibacterales bacterium]|nr:flagellar motor protein [Vicinamibacterales bacterium]